MAIGSIDIGGTMVEAELVLERTDPSLIAGAWDVVANAILTRRRQGPLRDVQLDFFLNGRAYEAEKTDEHGRASVTLPGLQPGGYRVGVQVRGGALSASDKFSVRPIIRIPGDFDAHSIGDPNRGEYRIVVGVYAKDGGGGCRGKVQIFDEYGEPLFDDFTDDNGDLLFPSKDKLPNRYSRATNFLVRVTGLQKEEPIKLAAPPQYRPHYKPDNYNEYSWWRRLWWNVGNNNNIWWWIDSALVVLLPFLIWWAWSVPDQVKSQVKRTSEYQKYSQMSPAQKAMMERTWRLQGKEPPTPDVEVSGTSVSSQGQSSGRSTLKSLAWAWLVAFLMNIPIFIFVHRDEASRAWARAMRRLHEERGGTPMGAGQPAAAGVPQAAPAQATPQTRSLFSRYFLRGLWLFGSELLAEVFGGAIERRIGI